MKKVVSALTAAAMCASMAGIASVFAYTTDEVGYYLGVTSEGAGYTVSEDGKTITFASAADAAGAKFTVGHFIDADTSKPAVQQIGGMVEGSSPMVHMAVGSDTQLTASTGKTVTVTDTNGNSADIDLKPNPFGYIDFLGLYSASCGALNWGHSSEWPADWYSGSNERVTWVWSYGFDQGDYADGTTTAHFLTKESDTYSLVDFEVTLDSAITDGTYTIDWVQTSKNNFDDAAQVTFLNSGDSVLMPIGTLEGLTIVVGDGATEEPTTEAPTTEPTTEAPTTEPTTEQPGEVETPGNADPGKYAWDIEDNVQVELLNNNRVAYIDVYVWNDEGTNGYTVDIDIEGGEFADLGMKLAKISQGDAYPKLATFVANTAEGSAAAANTDKDDQSSQFAANGAVALTYLVSIPDTVADGVYKLTFNDNTTIGGDGVEMKPELMSGTLVIGDAEVEEPTTEPTEEPTTEPTEEPTTAPTDEPTTEPTTQPTQEGDYLYGDVNKNGKVELVDIVMLNRKLTGYGDQQLDDYQTEVADCWDDGALDGKDSTTILQYLIGLVASLPVAAK